MQLLSREKLDGSQLQYVLEALDFDVLMTRALKQLSDAIAADLFEIFILDPELDSYVLRATSDGVHASLRECSFKRDIGPFGHVVSGRLPVLFESAPNTMPYEGPKYPTQIRSLLTAPIVDQQGIPWGLLVLGTEKGHLENVEHLTEWIKCFATYLAFAIKNARAYQPIEKRARYYNHLFAMTGEMVQVGPLAHRLHHVAVQLREQFNVEAVQIFLVNKHAPERLSLAALSIVDNDIQTNLINEESEFPVECQPDSGPTAEVLALAQPKSLREFDATQPFNASLTQRLKDGKVHSYLGVPLKGDAVVHGVVELINKNPSTPWHRDWFTVQDTHFLTDFAKHLALLLERQEVFRNLEIVSRKAVQLQRIVAFGTFAQRIPSRVISPLHAAHAMTLRLEKEVQAPQSTEASADHILNRLSRVREDIDEALNELRFAGDFSLDAGFARTYVNINDLLKDLFVVTDSERRAKKINLSWTTRQLPEVLTEANDVFVVLWTILRVIFDAATKEGVAISIETQVDGPPANVIVIFEATGDSDFYDAINKRVVEAGEPSGTLESMGLLFSAAKETITARRYGASLRAEPSGHAHAWIFRLSLPVKEGLEP